MNVHVSKTKFCENIVGLPMLSVTLSSSHLLITNNAPCDY